MSIKNSLSVVLSLLATAIFSTSTHAQLSIQAPASSVVVNASINLTAISNPGSLPMGLMWKSIDENIAIVDSTGKVTGKSASDKGVIITVTDPATGKLASILLPVTPGTPSSFTISAQPQSIIVNGTSTLSATGNYIVNGKTISAPITSGITWTSALPADAKKIAIKDNVVTGVQQGTANIIGMNPIFPAVASSQTVQITVNILSSDLPQFAEAPQGGNSYINVFGKNGQTLALYQFDRSYDLASGNLLCDVTQGTLLQTIPPGAGASPAWSQTLSADGQTTLTLLHPIVAGTKLCLVNTAAIPMLSAFQSVNDPNDFGRVRTYLTVGVQISNQLPASTSGTTQSSTAGEYLETGLTYSLFRAAPRPPTFATPLAVGASKAAHWHPGVQTVFDVRLSPVPVSAPVSTGMGTTVAAPTISNLNVLSSQQSARITGQLYFPTRLSNWQSGYNVMTIAPLAKAGFTTLLNPNSSIVSSTGIATITNFSPTYSFFGFGGRLAWDQYSAISDKAPQMVTQLNVALSKYSSLPSYMCTSDTTKLGPTYTTVTDPKSGTSTSTKNTGINFTSACGLPLGTLAALPYISRTLAYRLDIDGIARLPGYPFVLGVSANLAQYSLGHTKNIDYLNKPGNDIRIFIGLTVPLSSLGSLITTGSVNK